MASLQDVRAQYPQYNDLSDAALADGLYRKFYSDMPRAEYDKKIGFTPETALGPKVGELQDGGTPVPPPAAPAPAPSFLDFDEMGRPVPTSLAELRAQNAQTLQTGRTLAEGAASGATLGQGVYGTAAGHYARSRVFGGDQKSFADELEAARQQQKDIRAENPAAYGAGQLAGGLGLGIGAAQGGAVGGLTLAPKLANAPLTLAPRLANAPLLARAAGFGAEGAGWGGADAALNAEGKTLPERVQEAAHGAETGFLLGYGLPVLGSAAGGTFRAAQNWFGSAPEGIKGAAAKLLGQFLPENAPQTLQKTGPEASILDVSPSMQGLGQGITSKPNPPGDRLNAHLLARDEATNGRLLRSVDDRLGADNQTPTGLLTDIEATKRTVTEPQFQAGYSDPLAVPPDVAAAPSVQKAMGKAARIAADERKPLLMVTRDEQGNIVPNNAAAQFKAGSLERLDTALGDALGFRGPLSEADKVRARRKAEADPFYETGNKTKIDYDTEAGQALLDEHERIATAFPEALSTAKRLLAAEGKTGISGQNAAAAVEAGPALKAGEHGSGGRKPPTLAQFIAREGGLELNGDTKDLARTLSGQGRLVHERGKSIDGFWRDRLIEEGYLPRDADGGQARDIRDELIDRLQRNPDARPEGWREAGRVRMTPEEHAQREALRSEVARDLVAARTPLHTIDPEALDRAAQKMAGARSMGRSGLTGEAAYAEAVAEAANANAAADKPRTLLTARHWDYIKRGLDDVIKANTDLAGNTTQLGRAAVIRKQALLKQLDEAVPDLKTARGIWSDESGGLDALEMGKKAASAGYTRERVARDVADLGDSERELYALGLGGSVREGAANVANPASKVTPALLDKIEAVRGPQARAKLEQALAAEERAFTQAQEPNAEAWKRAHDALTGMAAKDPEDAGFKAAGKAVREALETNPNFKTALERSDYYDKVKGAAERGRLIFNKGKDNHINPIDLAAERAAMTAGEKAGQYKGAASMVRDIMGLEGNDLVALEKGFGKSADYANQNARQVFGDEPLQGLLDDIASNRRMRESFQRIYSGSGSQTELRKQGVKAVDEAGRLFPPDATAFGTAAHMGHKAYQVLARRFTESAGNVTREELTRLAMLPPEERDRVVQAVLSLRGQRAESGRLLRDAIANPVTLQGLLDERPGRRRGALLH